MKNLIFAAGLMTAMAAWTEDLFIGNHLAAVMGLVAAALMIGAALILEGMEK